MPEYTPDNPTTFPELRELLDATRASANVYRDALDALLVSLYTGPPRVDVPGYEQPDGIGPNDLVWCPCGCSTAVYRSTAEDVARERNLPFLPMHHEYGGINPHDGYGGINAPTNPDLIPEEDPVPIPAGTDPRCVTVDNRGRTVIAPRPAVPATVEAAQAWEATCLAAWQEDNTAETRTALFRAMCDTDMVASSSRGSTPYRTTVPRFVSAVSSRMSSRRYVYGSMTDRYGVRFCSPQCMSNYGITNERWYDRQVRDMGTVPSAYNSESWEVLDRRDPRVVARGHSEGGYCQMCYVTLGTLPTETQYHLWCEECGDISFMRYGFNPDDTPSRCNSCEVNHRELEMYCHGCGYYGEHDARPDCTGTVDDIAGLIASFAPMVTEEPVAPEPAPARRVSATVPADPYAWLTMPSYNSAGTYSSNLWDFSIAT